MSVPMPKQNTRTARPPAAARARSRICFSSVLPMVGLPSVRNTTTYGRSGEPAPGAGASAAARASSIAVPPMGLSSFTKAAALARWSASAGASRPKSGSASVAKRTISKRSPAFRFCRQNWSARLAWSSLPPSAMEPEVSRTNTTSFWTICSPASRTEGDASSRK